MKISTTYTVAGETFDTEQQALDYAHFIERKRSVQELISPLFREHVQGIAINHNAKQIAHQIVEHPELFRQALDIVEGK